MVTIMRLRDINLPTAILLHFLIIFPLSASDNADQQNIVLVLMDNFGWGELGTYGGGILRGGETPRIDQLADEGLKLLNFNVEPVCTASRAALLTGRYAIRSGTARFPMETNIYGLTQWEYTLAEMLSDIGYATGIFGKWHLGQTQGRFPTDQGFDEWYGIPNTSDEAEWPDNDLFDPNAHPNTKYSYVMEGRKNEVPNKVTVYDRKERLLIDENITNKAIDFMKRKVDEKKPFFAYVPYTQTHMPVQPHPDFKGKSGNGHIGDVLIQIDAYVGRLLDTVDDLGIREKTIFIFTSDNGPESMDPWFGFAGPWRGTYITGTEGSLRVPFIIRWPNRVPAGSVSNEIVHQMDIYTTIAKIVNGQVKNDRIIDGVNQLEHFLGQQEKSNREGFVVYNVGQVWGVKWRNWKVMFKEKDKAHDPTIILDYARFYNLHLDPREEHASAFQQKNLWVRWPAMQILHDHLKSMEQEPPIKSGTPDPYLPAN